MSAWPMSQGIGSMLQGICWAEGCNLAKCHKLGKEASWLMLQLTNTAELVRQDNKLANVTADQYGQASEARLQAGQCYSWPRDQPIKH